MTPMNTNGIPWNIGRREKGQPHDVVPMQVRHKKVIHLWLAGTVFVYDLLPQAAQSRAHVTYHVVATADNLDTGRVATVTLADGKSQFRVDEALQRCLTRKTPAICLPQGLPNLVTHFSTAQRHRQRTACA